MQNFLLFDLWPWCKGGKGCLICFCFELVPYWTHCSTFFLVSIKSTRKTTKNYIYFNIICKILEYLTFDLCAARVNIVRFGSNFYHIIFRRSLTKFCSAKFEMRSPYSTEMQIDGLGRMKDGRKDVTNALNRTLKRLRDNQNIFGGWVMLIFVKLLQIFHDQLQLTN